MASPKSESATTDRPEGVEFDRHFSVNEIADAWHLSREAVRKLFADEPGVLRLGHGESFTKRQYITMRIPASVVKSVHRRLRQGPRNNTVRCVVRHREVGKKAPQMLEVDRKPDSEGEQLRPLTPSEHRVFKELKLAKQDKEIAVTLNITTRTVRFHVSNILRKLGLSRRAEILAKNWPS